MSAVATVRRPVRLNRKPLTPARVILHGFLIVMALVWLFPLAWPIYTALRPISDTITQGYVSWPSHLSLANFTTVWVQADMLHFFVNTMLIVVPGVVLTLLLASMVAFALTQFSWRFNILVLMIFTAGNLLPPQVIIVPLYWIYLNIPVPIDYTIGGVELFSDNGLLYDQTIGIILIFTFIYNDFFWALVLMKSGDKRPITAALNNLHGAFFTNYNLLAAGALLAAIPPVVIFILLQKHFVRGLTLGSTKG